MRIIATINKSAYSPSFMVEATDYELKTLIGDPYSQLELAPGDVIDVIASFDRIEKLKLAQKKLKTCKDTLRLIIDSLEPLDPLEVIDNIETSKQ